MTLEQLELVKNLEQAIESASHVQVDLVGEDPDEWFEVVKVESNRKQLIIRPRTARFDEKDRLVLFGAVSNLK